MVVLYFLDALKLDNKPWNQARVVVSISVRMSLRKGIIRLSGGEDFYMPYASAQKS